MQRGILGSVVANRLVAGFPFIRALKAGAVALAIKTSIVDLIYIYTQQSSLLLGVVDYALSGATTSDFQSGASATAATFGAQDTSVNLPLIATALSDTFGQAVPTTRFSLSLTSTVYLIAEATFSAGAVSAYGTLRARKMG